MLQNERVLIRHKGGLENGYHKCIVLMSSVVFTICEFFNKIAFLKVYHSCMRYTNIEVSAVIIRFPFHSGFNSVTTRAIVFL